MATKSEANNDQTNEQTNDLANVDNADALKAKENVKLVMMVRDPDIYEAPHEASVHPDEVQNYHSGGWVEKKDEAK